MSLVLGADFEVAPDIAPEVSVAGEKLQTVPLGKPLQENVRDESKPLCGVTVTSVLPGWLGETFMVVWESTRL